MPPTGASVQYDATEVDYALETLCFFGVIRLFRGTFISATVSNLNIASLGGVMKRFIHYSGVSRQWCIQGLHRKYRVKE